MTDDRNLIPSDGLLSEEFLAQADKLKAEMYRKYREISNENTPEVDGNGNKIVRKRPDGKDYIIEPYIRLKLDEYFPGWSWQRAGGIQFLGSEWVVADGELTIIDVSLLAFGILPPVRRFWGGDAVRVQYKQGQAHTPENIIDIGDNVQSAITGAFKRAANRLTHIGDDKYAKRIEMEGAGTTEELIESQAELGGSAGISAVSQYLAREKILISKACKLLGIKALTKIENPAEALRLVKEAKQNGKL